MALGERVQSFFAWLLAEDACYCPLGKPVLPERPHVCNLLPYSSVSSSVQTIKSMSPEGIIWRITEDGVCAVQTTEATKEGLSAVNIVMTDYWQLGAEMEFKAPDRDLPLRGEQQAAGRVRGVKDCELLALLASFSSAFSHSRPFLFWSPELAGCLHYCSLHLFSFSTFFCVAALFLVVL